MIIDTHTHLYSDRMAPSLWIDTMADYGGAVSGRPPESVRKRIVEGWFDETGDLLIADMDTAGVDHSVVFVLDFGPYAGTEDSVSLKERYELFHRAIERHPTRISLFGGIDPRRPDASRFIRRAKAEWNIKGVKIWPPAGAMPNAPYCYRLYQTCAELDLPVVIHTGQEIGPMHSDTTHPSLCDQPASDFPELTFVLAHAGMGWWEEAAEMAWHHPNVHLDIAYWQSKLLRHPGLFQRELRDLITLSGPTKVMFGSDWPAMRLVPKARHEVFVDALASLPRNGISGVSFGQEEIDLLLGGNAQRVYKLGR
jgi:predicted TIM-barrel fold metal-dependent hydrolase